MRWVGVRRKGEKAAGVGRTRAAEVEVDAELADFELELCAGASVRACFAGGGSDEEESGG